MEISESDILELTVNIWNSVLEMEASPADASAPLPETERTLSGCITLDGAWKGAVALHCSTGLARRVASVIFGVAPEMASQDEVQDALGELTNMIGGQMKSLLPRPTHLSLPAVAEGVDYTLRIPGCRILNQVRLDCAGESFVVTLLHQGERETLPAAGSAQEAVTR